MEEHNYAQFGTKGWKVKKENDCDSIQCSLLKNPIVYLEPSVRQKIELLMKEYPHQEWLGYLVGRVSEKENFFVEDLSIPPHKEALGASAEAEPFHIPDNCIGVIHSHNSMGAFHSGTDQSYVDKNFLVSVVVAKKYGQEIEYDTISYQTTACGKGTTIKCPVKYVLPKPEFDTEEFLEQAKANVDKGKKVYTYTPPVTGFDGRPYGATTEPLVPHYMLDKEGHVMTQKDIDAVMDSIWDD